MDSSFSDACPFLAGATKLVPGKTNILRKAHLKKTAQPNTCQVKDITL